MRFCSNVMAKCGPVLSLTGTPGPPDMPGTPGRPGKPGGPCKENINVTHHYFTRIKETLNFNATVA